MINTYTHLIILDFEATCDDENAPRPQEVIEFPSVLLSLETLEIVDEFQAFVRPIHNPQLTDFCKNFTSIQQRDVDQADLFTDVLKAHLEWLKSHELDETNSIIVTCGDWDLGNMFPSQCPVAIPPVENLHPLYTSWMNIKRLFCKVLNCKKAPGMAGMLRKLNLKLIGLHHRGIDDCRNIAAIAKLLIERGAEVSSTASLPLSKYPPISLTFYLGDRKEKAVLKIRNLSSLYGLAGKVFKCKVSGFKLANGKILEVDQDLRALNSGEELFLIS